jgi:hypothetical protein
MTKAIRFFVLWSVVALVPAVAFAAPGDGIDGTAHDFAGIGNPATGLCTFCHTPHKAQSTLLVWNHTLSTNNFAWDEPVTTAGTQFPEFSGETYKGPTAKCLSCHDGSVAVGDIGWWNGGDPGSLLNFTIGPGALQIGGGGDMSGNHPVAMPIPYQNAPSTYNGTTTGPGVTLADWKADPTTSGIRLFNDDGGGTISAGPIAGQTGIECSSCHDAHNGANVQGPWFLLGELGGDGPDYICIKCHTKE